MNGNSNQVCNLCHNHCSIENLKCEKGRNYFNIDKSKERSGVVMSNKHEESYEKQFKQNNHGDHQDSNHQGRDHQGRDNQSRDHQGRDHQGREHQGNDHHSSDYQGSDYHGRDQHGSVRQESLSHEKDDLLILLEKAGHFMKHKRSGKRSQTRILKILAEHPEISQKELQNVLGIESGSMSEIVIKLENKGFITRTKDETDKRITKLIITELGLNFTKEIESKDTEEDALLLNLLTVEEQQQLKVLLQKMLQGWKDNLEEIRGCRHDHSEGEEHSHKGGRRRRRFQ